MDVKSLAKSKRAHTQSHSKRPHGSHANQKSKAPSVGTNDAGRAKKPLGKQVPDPISLRVRLDFPQTGTAMRKNLIQGLKIRPSVIALVNLLMLFCQRVKEQTIVTWLPRLSLNLSQIYTWIAFLLWMMLCLVCPCFFFILRCNFFMSFKKF